MAFDEQGQADTAERKVAVLARAYRLLTEQAGFDPADIVFDPAVLAVGTGIEEHNAYAHCVHRGGARRSRRAFPEAKVSGGVSNLSFAFRGNDPVREAIHSAFLYHASAPASTWGSSTPGSWTSTRTSRRSCSSAVEDLLFDRRPDATERLVQFAGPCRAEAPQEGGGGRVAERARSKSAWRTRSCTASSITSKPTSRRRCRAIPGRSPSSRGR